MSEMEMWINEGLYPRFWLQKLYGYKSYNPKIKKRSRIEVQREGGGIKL